MSNEQDFSINVSDLKTNAKKDTPQVLNSIDSAGEARGFVARAPRRRGRKASPRTGQVHARVLPAVAREISNEARQRGAQQGVLIEEAWELYKKAKTI